jgi:hypothetical protein
MDSLMLWFGTACVWLAALVMITVAGLKAWHGWLELKRLEIGHGRPMPPAERIELADLRERIRKLESIAACVDL